MLQIFQTSRQTKTKLFIFDPNCKEFGTIIIHLPLPVKSVLKTECNYSVHVRTVQLKSKLYLQLQIGWSTIYIWDCTGRVMDPSLACN